MRCSNKNKLLLSHPIQAIQYVGYEFSALNIILKAHLLPLEHLSQAIPYNPARSLKRHIKYCVRYASTRRLT